LDCLPVSTSAGSGACREKLSAQLLASKSLGVNKVNKINDIITPYCTSSASHATSAWRLRKSKLTDLQGLFPRRRTAMIGAELGQGPIRPITPRDNV
jgi:hypothetical protein